MRVRTSPDEDVRPQENTEQSGEADFGRGELNERDIEIINANSERLNREAMDTLEYQADWSAE